ALVAAVVCVLTAGPPTSAASKKKGKRPSTLDCAKSAGRTYTGVFAIEEGVNLDALFTLASPRAADTVPLVCHEGEADEYRGNTLRRELCWLMRRLNSHSKMQTYWRDTCLGVPEALANKIEDVEGQVGACTWDVTKGLFTFPKWLRNVLRTPGGINVDQSMSHCFAQLERHPDAVCLRYYVNNRAECEGFAGDRDLAKRLFRGRMNGGGANHVMSIMGKEQTLLMQKDADAHPQLAQVFQANGYHWPAAAVQSLLNERHERAVLNLMENVARRCGKVQSYEHDGLYCVVHEHLRETMMNDIRQIASVSTQAPASLDETLQYLQTKFPEHDWSVRDEGWEELEDARIEVRQRCLKGETNFPKLIADVVPHHVTSAGYQVRELMKATPVTTDRVTLMTYDNGCWRDLGAVAAATLEDVMRDVLKKCIGKRPVQGWPRVVHCAHPQDCSDYQLKKMHLEVAAIWSNLEEEHLDLEDVVTRALAQEQFAAVQATSCKALPAGFRYSTDLEEDLARLQRILPGVELLHSCHEDYADTMFLLKVLSRVKGSRQNFEECFFHLGHGQNGKGTLNLVLRCFCGDYHYEPKPETFTSLGDPTGCSLNISQLKGRRSLFVNEVEAGVKLRSGMLKDLRDQTAFIEARGLYRDPIQFKMRRSFTSVPWPLKFIMNPRSGTNERPSRDIKNSNFMMNSVVPSLEVIFPIIDRIVFRGYNGTLIEPRPHSIVTATLALFECMQELDMKAFLEEHLLQVESANMAAPQGSIRSWIRQQESVRDMRLSPKALERMLDKILTPK
ncbi:unnamed protein product, partial [Effrenium voratum]